MNRWIRRLHTARVQAKNNVLVDAQLQVISDREAFVEGCCGILEYDENLVRLNGRKLELRFLGSRLLVTCLNRDNVLITGNIQSIEFVRLSNPKKGVVQS